MSLVKNLRIPGHSSRLMPNCLTNVISGDLARQLDTLKEVEAQKGSPVMSICCTNIKHGATYAMEDLLGGCASRHECKDSWEAITDWD